MSKVYWMIKDMEATKQKQVEKDKKCAAAYREYCVVKQCHLPENIHNRECKVLLEEMIRLCASKQTPLQHFTRS